MSYRMFHSFRAQLLFNISWVVLILVISSTWILFSTVRLQTLAGETLAGQETIDEACAALETLREPLLEYLSNRSSDALSQVLILSQSLRARLDIDSPIPLDETALRTRELHFLFHSWLDLADSAIEEKRGMDVAGYTARFDEMERIRSYISEENARLSAVRFANQQKSYSLFVSLSRNIQLLNLLFIISISAFSILLLLHVADKMNEPMANLSRMASEISAGRFDAEDVGMSSMHEIDHVVEAFNRMKRDIHTYIQEIRWQRNVEQEYMNERVRNMKMEQMMRRMELYTLQAQMNPHFLFNTLNTGIQLAIVEGAERTSEYMDHLARLFRHNLREKNVIVPLRHEIEGLESFFYILRVRFPKNLDLILDCPEELLDAHQVPASILQPLVENSVVHGFNRSEGRNSIIVRVFETPGRLALSVSDNGTGIPHEDAERLFVHPQGEDGLVKVTGLANVIHRLRFFWPDDPGVVRIASTGAPQGALPGAGYVHPAPLPEDPGAYPPLPELSPPEEGSVVFISIDTGRAACIPS